MDRLKGVRVVPVTENGRRALDQSFEEEYSADQKSLSLYRGFWAITRSLDGAEFKFRKAALAAIAAARFTTAGRLRREYERNLPGFLAQFHEMMYSCGAAPSDYELEVVWG